MNKESIKNFFKKNIGRIIYLSVIVVFIVVLAILRKNSDISEYFFARGISRIWNKAISAITGLFTFSLTEWCYVLVIALALFAVIYMIVALIKRKFSRFFKTLYTVVAVVLTMVFVLNLTYTGNYNRHSAANYLSLADGELSTKTCADASVFYSVKLNDLQKELSFDENGDVVSPYSFGELSELINEEYLRLDKDYFGEFAIAAKPVIMSKAMSYMGITGQFTCFTAECNVSVDVPSYQLPVTMAHELAHLRGVAKENEANFTAYYLLLTSDNSYLRYCALMYASVIMLNESYDPLDRADYDYALSYFTTSTLNQYTNANAHWAKYDTFLDDVGDFFNDLYLKSSGQSDGVKSYSDTGYFLLKLYYALKD